MVLPIFNSKRIWLFFHFFRVFSNILLFWLVSYFLWTLFLLITLFVQFLYLFLHLSTNFFELLDHILLAFQIWLLKISPFTLRLYTLYFLFLELEGLFHRFRTILFVRLKSLCRSGKLKINKLNLNLEKFFISLMQIVFYLLIKIVHPLHLPLQKLIFITKLFILGFKQLILLLQLVYFNLVLLYNLLKMLNFVHNHIVFTLLYFIKLTYLHMQWLVYKS